MEDFTSDMMQINSNTFIIKRGSSFYDNLEEELKKEAEIQNLDNITSIDIELYPDKCEYIYNRYDKQAFVGSIVNTLVDNPITELAREFPTVTALLNVLASYLIEKKKNPEGEASIFLNGIIPYFEATLGGLGTAVGGRIAQALGLGPVGQVVSRLAGFLFDNLSKISSSDRKEKEQLEAMNKHISGMILGKSSSKQIIDAYIKLENSVYNDETEALYGLIKREKENKGGAKAHLKEMLTAVNQSKKRRKNPLSQDEA